MQKHGFFLLKPLFSVALALVFLSACHPAEYMATAGYTLYAETKPDEPPQQDVPITFCYKTLAAVNCYDAPQAAQEYRFTGPHFYPQFAKKERKKEWYEKGHLGVLMEKLDLVEGDKEFFSQLKTPENLKYDTWYQQRMAQKERHAPKPNPFDDLSPE